MYNRLQEWLKANPDLGFTFIEEPWLKNASGKMCQPDSVLLDHFTDSAVVIEVKLNWKDGRDEKLRKTYLSAAASAFGVSTTWPLLITRNLRGYKGEPLLGLTQIERVFAWRPPLITPVMLLP